MTIHFSRNFRKSALLITVVDVTDEVGSEEELADGVYSVVATPSIAKAESLSVVVLDTFFNALGTNEICVFALPRLKGRKKILCLAHIQENWWCRSYQAHWAKPCGETERGATR